MPNSNKYKFSFTTASLRLREMILVARHKLDGTDIDYTNEIGNGKSSTGKRLFLEFNARIATLTNPQIKLLVNGDLNNQKQIAFLSICKTYNFIRDFVIEVLREKLLVFDYEITDGNYISFYRRKAEIHPELERLTETTEKKIRQVTFKILEEAGIINNVKIKNIQPQLLDNKVIDVIVSENPNWLKLFFYSDTDIANLTY